MIKRTNEKNKIFLDTKPLFLLIKYLVLGRSLSGLSDLEVKALEFLVNKYYHESMIYSTWPVLTETLYFTYKDFRRYKDWSNILDKIKGVFSKY